MFMSSNSILVYASQTVYMFSIKCNTCTMMISETLARHETPVAWKTVEVVHLDDDLVVVDKPCSIPVRTKYHRRIKIEEMP